MCNKARLDAGGRRSAFSKGSGTAGAGTTIDHYDSRAGSRSTASPTARSRRSTGLAGYVRTGDGTVRTMTARPGRDALTFTFQLKDPNERFGTVIVFKDGKEAYVITIDRRRRARPPTRPRETVAESLEPQA